MDAQEAALHAVIADALADAGLETVEVEVDRDTVTLRGHVTDVAAISRAERIVDGVAGVADVVNRLVVRT